MSSKKNIAGLAIGIALAVLIVFVLIYFFMFSPHANFKRLISEADEHYAAERFSKAKELYSEAFQYKQDEPYAQQRIMTIDSILTLRNMQFKYNQKIEMADSLFVMKNYTRARDYYFEALNIDPDDTYPVMQIKKIEDLLQNPDAQIVQNNAGNPEHIFTEPENPDQDKSYHIIVGVFNDRDNAINLKQKLEGKGLNPCFVPRFEYNMVGVSYRSFEKVSEALQYLNTVREQFNEKAWILRYNEQE